MHMDNRKDMSAASRKSSIVYAIRGIVQVFRKEPNAKIHALTTLAVIVAGILRHIHPIQWIALVFAIGLVWMAEVFNTCIEELANFACDGKWHPAIKNVKDLSAGAVLVA